MTDKPDMRPPSQHTAASERFCTKEAYIAALTERDAARAQRDALADALRAVLRMCDEICRADHENRNAYYAAGEVGDTARAALAQLEQGQ